jgi:hypothetical protein
VPKTKDNTLSALYKLSTDRKDNTYNIVARNQADIINCNIIWGWDKKPSSRISSRKQPGYYQKIDHLGPHIDYYHWEIILFSRADPRTQLLKWGFYLLLFHKRSFIANFLKSFLLNFGEILQINRGRKSWKCFGVIPKPRRGSRKNKARLFLLFMTRK